MRLFFPSFFFLDVVVVVAVVLWQAVHFAVKDPVLLFLFIPPPKLLFAVVATRVLFGCPDAGSNL